MRYSRLVFDVIVGIEAERLKAELKAAEEEKKAQLAANPTPTDQAKEEKEPSKDGVVEDQAVDLLANLPLKAKLGLQAKSAIEKNEPVGIPLFIVKIVFLHIYQHFRLHASRLCLALWFRWQFSSTRVAQNHLMRSGNKCRKDKIDLGLHNCNWTYIWILQVPENVVAQLMLLTMLHPEEYGTPSSHKKQGSKVYVHQSTATGPTKLIQG